MPSPVPTIMIRLLEAGNLQVVIPTGMNRAMVNLLLDHAKLQVLTQPTDGQRHALQKPNGGMAGLLARAGVS